MCENKVESILVTGSGIPETKLILFFIGWISSNFLQFQLKTTAIKKIRLLLLSS
jgi:hypothetical protein